MCELKGMYHLHYDDTGNPIYLSGKKLNNHQRSKSFYQIMQERHYKAIQWEIKHSRN